MPHVSAASTPSVSVKLSTHRRHNTPTIHPAPLSPTTIKALAILFPHIALQASQQPSHSV